ncbi:uncharacterized protein LOC115649438 [Gopherus evgoodei]|uniref:uncharacterized protein LOC115649438 n=1 Tax=Gopherus evgoodei TaxID=1825980 RepID=UPI0011CF3B84|nr:uncharacterized protein LOC115649438 [Gopherus evgoodei]
MHLIAIPEERVRAAESVVSNEACSYSVPLFARVPGGRGGLLLGGPNIAVPATASLGEDEEDATERLGRCAREKKSGGGGRGRRYRGDIGSWSSESDVRELTGERPRIIKGKMGSALSVEEKTVHEFLLRIAEKQGEKISPESLSRLLKWGQRRGFFITPNTVFDKTVWERLGSDLWESITHGNKEAVTLSQIWCKTKKVVETLAAEAEVQAAVDEIFHPKKADESPAVQPDPPIVLPVGAKEFFSGEEVVIPTAPGFDPDEPNVDPHMVPLPLDSDDFEKMDTDHIPFTESAEFREEMKRQGHQLQAMLDKLSRMAGETSPPQSHLLKTLQDYENYKVKPPGTSAFESNFMRNYKTKPPDKTTRPVDVASPCPWCGSWGCTEHKTARLDNTLHASDVAASCLHCGRQGCDGKCGQLPGRPLIRQNNPFLAKPPAYSSDAAGANSPDPVRRWRGLIKEAHIEGEFIPTAFPVIAPDPHNPARRQWAPLDWKLIREAQKAIMSYGMNNPYVQSIVEQVFVGQAMCPYDSLKFADMLLTPTQRLLWKDNWSKRVELALLRNIELDENNPLRFATQDMLMGTGTYADPQRQARLDPRILQQSQRLALAAFKDVPQIGKPNPPYAKIVQDPSEPYSTFLDRLREAIDRSPNLTAEAKTAVGLDLAIQNANAVCRRILATLPKTASLTEMVEACSRASMYEETDKAEIHAKAHASALAVALKPLVAFAMTVTQRKPSRMVCLHGPDGRQIRHEALLDTGADSVGGCFTKLAFCLAAIEGRPILRLEWLTSTPVWVAQWPLPAHKLARVHELVQEQLEKGHLEPSLSPWNTPIFTIPKKSGKWRLLHDLRAINAVMKDMGALQPGLPTPTMLPRNWPLLIIDLKDCFFTIPLHPDDKDKFAFSVPSVNKAEPAQRYQWTVLPQGMKNSPTICQFYVAWALRPLRSAHPDWLIYHYMDDILFAAATLDPDTAISEITSVLQSAGLTIAPDKVQRQAPYFYLGMRITDSIVRPQKLTFNLSIHNLHDVQRLVGDLQWVRGLCGISNEDLAPLLQLLKGGRDPAEPRSLQPHHEAALRTIADKITLRYSGRVLPGSPVSLAILSRDTSLEALLFQWLPDLPDPLVCLEWIFPSSQFSKTVTTRLEAIASLLITARSRTVAITGADPDVIYVPFNAPLLSHIFATDVSFATALLYFTGRLTNHYPPHRLLSVTIPLEKAVMRQSSPVQGLTVFTDASGKMARAAILWYTAGAWHHEMVVAEGSLQVLEFQAIIRAFAKWPSTPLNIVSDSLYAVGVANRLERSLLKQVPNPVLWRALLQLWHLLDARSCPYFITHIRSHSGIVDGLAQGNALVDQLVGSVHVPDSFAQARLSHDFFHQSARALARQFKLPLSTTRALVASCPSCQQHVLPPSFASGVNPRGLSSLQIWQTDVTLFSEFGSLKYVHVTVDTFSGFLWATALASTGSRDVIKHWQVCFAVMGIPASIKTDNGAGYISRRTARFLSLWGISHVTGVPGNSTGQAIVERSHASLKSLLLKQKGGIAPDADPLSRTPHARLSKALYVLNWLQVGPHNTPPVMRHFAGATGQDCQLPRPQVRWFNYTDQKWQGPADLLTWGRGYACVSTVTGPRCLPAKWVRPWLARSNPEQPSTDPPSDPEDANKDDDNIPDLRLLFG